MKKTLCIFSCLILSFCKAQTPIIDRYGNSNWGKISGAYYKDVNNYHDLFAGTWVFENNGTILKIIIEKRNFILNDLNNFYEDILVGEYQYIVNNVERINTLNNLNNYQGSNTKDFKSQNIYGITKQNKHSYPKCNECLLNDRFYLYFSDPNFDNITISNSITIRSYSENGQQKLKVWLYSTSHLEPMDENGNVVPFSGLTVPYGQYVLTKVN